MLQSTIVTRSISGLLAAVLALCVLVPAAAAPARAHEALLPAPYQPVDLVGRGLVRFKSDRYRLDDGLGLKAQTAFGLLYRSEDVFRPRDYVRPSAPGGG